MAIVKLTASKRAIQFIDDDGNVYQTSLLYMQALLAGRLRAPFVLLSKLPLKVSEDRFKKSEVYDPANLASKVKLGDTAGKDVLSPTIRKQTKQIEQFQDKSVW